MIFSSNQNGSALFGICLFLSTATLCGLFILHTAHSAVLFSYAANRRAATLHEASTETQLLNQISTNNALMIASISKAIADYAESLHAGLGYQMTIPFWLSGAFEGGAARFGEKPLPEQSVVADYFATASKDLSDALMLAYGLNQDSRTAVQQLEARWKMGTDQMKQGQQGLNDFAESSLEELFCIALQNTAAMQKSKLVVALELSTMKKQRIQDCLVKISSFNVFSPRDFLKNAKLSPSIEFGVILLKRRENLCRSIAAKDEEWQQSPLWRLFRTKHFIKLAEHKVFLLHPRILVDELNDRTKTYRSVLSFHQDYCSTRAQPPNLQPMLEPNWAPVYLSEGLGQ